MPVVRRTAHIALSKDPDTGRPVAEIYTPKDVTLADIGALQQKLFADVLRKNGKTLGLKFCEGCRSGLDKIIIKDIATLPGKVLGSKVQF